MAILVAVSALHLFHVARLGAFIGTMSLAIAVAASDFLRVRALLGRMAFFAAVKAGMGSAAATLGAVAREVAHYENAILAAHIL